MRWSAVGLACVGCGLGCSLVKNADDVVVGNGSVDSASLDATDLDTNPPSDSADGGGGSDASSDVATDAVVDGADARDAVVDEDRRWALWPMPATTPTSYDTPSITVVLDKVTNLRWQKDTNAKANLATATKTCADLSLGGTTGWRLPFRVELVSLLAISPLNVPTINHTFFPGTPSSKQWTLSSRPKGGIYVVDFQNGTIGSALDTEMLEFRCVHSP